MYGLSTQSLNTLVQLQQCLHSNNVVLSSFLCHSSPTVSCNFPSRTLQALLCFRRLPISCSVSEVHSNATLNHERRTVERWKDVCKSIRKNPELRVATLLNQSENDGNNLTKWDICRVVRALRKSRSYERALEIYDWMTNRLERFPFSTSDAAILLDLISKVRGISQAEECFLNMPGDLKDKKIYGALLNVYAHARMKEKAESLFDEIRSKGFAVDSLTYSVMMTLYMNLKEYDKVNSLASEMIDKRVQLDLYSYNVWLCSCGSQGSAEKLEQVFAWMKQDPSIMFNWNTFSIMASMYIKLNQFGKAEECLRMVEDNIEGRGKVPYHYLLTLYGNMGKKEDVYRVWNTYKSAFPFIPNLGYQAIISSLVRMNDIERAEQLYEEWLSVNSMYDARVGNLLMSSYVKNGNINKALSFFDHMVEVGGKPHSTTWELCAEGHTAQRRVSNALACFKEAFELVGLNKWKPKPVNVSSFFKLCLEENDTASKEALVVLLSQSGFLRDQSYASSIGLTPDESSNSLSTPNGQHNDTIDDGSEMLVSLLDSQL